MKTTKIRITNTIDRIVPILVFKGTSDCETLLLSKNDYISVDEIKIKPKSDLPIIGGIEWIGENEYTYYLIGGIAGLKINIIELN